MAHSENNTLSFAFKTFFERETLTDPNFNDWYRSLRIVLRVADTFDYLYKPCLETADTGKMRGPYYISLGKPYDNDMLLILIQSLNKDFDKAPTPQVFTIQKGRDNKPKPQANKKVKGKGKADKNKQVVPYQPKPKPNPLKRKENPNRIKLCQHATLLGIGRGTALFISKSCVQIRRSLSPVLQDLKKKGNYLMGSLYASGHEHKQLGVVSLSCLLDLGFHHTIASNGISVSLNGIFYFSAISVNGVFEIDINNNVPKNNNNSIFSINKKRKLDLDSSYLWHCRLAHIGKTRMQKLHREGLLENIDEESFDKCESCISGKMTKKPFNKNIERATDLLGLIHTDNLTSPYTPQPNGVSEKRNRTLLDMVRSMFNVTTLPLSFWDYALESAVRILNMVPTKKLIRTYEIWHDKRRICSYLRSGLRGGRTYVKRDSADKL
ncbi:retrotransposon protein, putative, ty1-copia subclass [Tanacetum coccineum]|uniref:Retrotransposon protein, putative, ty1-copia subclass n=1 Tax=Tanacetum coccineum TaxID=301880 RepID=A0ABQ5HMD7_9ASTR